MIRGQTLSASERNGLITTKPYRWRGIPGWNPAQAPATPRPPKTKTPKIPTACGTYAGYGRHKRAKETPCDACREARAIYDRAYGFEKARRLARRQS